LAEETYDSIRDNLAMIIKDKKVDDHKVVETFVRLNGLPAYCGLIRQKYLLKEFVLKESRRHQRRIPKSVLRIRTRRKLYRYNEQ